MDLENNKRLLDFISPFVTIHKRERIEEVLTQRTRHLTVVLEDIYQSQNASAVIRSCECIGIQDVHIIEQKNSYKVNRDVLRGAGKWISLHRYKTADSVQDCFSRLRRMGYKIIGAAPETIYSTIQEIDINHKLAIVFGTELEGLSDFALKNVDGMVRIPMSGFTESFNLSVSAALVTFYLLTKVKTELKNWELTEREKLELRVEWYKKSIKNAVKLEAEFFRLYPGIS
jgi:tRNA (guanosine-2'-O-)-methyltransferase